MASGADRRSRGRLPLARQRRGTAGAQPDKSARATALERTKAASVRQRYRLLFEHNLAGVYCTTLDGTVLDCNESFAAMMGYGSRHELLGHRAQELYFQVSDRNAFLARLRKTGMLVNSELRLRRKDGSPLDILENVLLTPDEQGRPRIIQGTAVDITERKRAEQALGESARRHQALADDLRRLSQHLQTVREEERRRIARELHDELGQALTALNLDLHWLRDRLAKNSATARRRLASMCALVTTTIQAVRRICADLRPALLDDLGLTAAIEFHVREFETRTGIRCRLDLPHAPLKLRPEVATAVFRVLQESLTNAARHAQATHVAVALGVKAAALVLRVHDDGVGISDREPSGANSLGLIGMRERAVRWGGKLDIVGVPGHGTTVTLRIPAAKTNREPEA